MERYTDQTTILPDSLPQILKPLFRINYLLGTFPYKVKLENGKINVSSKSFQYYRTVLTTAIIGFSIFANMYRAIQIVFSPPAYTSTGEPIPIIGQMVELMCGVYANLITIIILGLTFTKKKILLKFFCEMEIYGLALGRYLDPESVSSRAKKMYCLYGVIAAFTSVAIGIRYYVQPRYGPSSVFLELTGLEPYIPPETGAIISGILVFYLGIAKIACIGYVEIVCACLSTCFSRAIGNIQEYIEREMEVWKRQYKGFVSQGMDKEDFLNLLAPSTPETQASNKHSKFQDELENYIGQIRELNPGLISASIHDSLKSSSLPPARLSSSSIPQFLKNTPGKVLSHAARKFQCVASMQDITNTVFGLTLAINIGCVVAMSVILKYLVISIITARLKKVSITQTALNGSILEGGVDHDFISGNNETYWANVTENATTLNGIMPLDSDIFGSLEWLMFLGVDLSMFVRLGVSVIFLGDVHRASLQFNSVMGKAFLAANRLNDELTSLVGVNEGEEIAKILMTPIQTSSIMAFINLNNANPVAFSAGGLFVFSRGLLLMIISIIISYLVFLLQASE